jgi:hypothetical protein
MEKKNVVLHGRMTDRNEEMDGRKLKFRNFIPNIIFGCRKTVHNNHAKQLYVTDLQLILQQAYKNRKRVNVEPQYVFFSVTVYFF